MVMFSSLGRGAAGLTQLKALLKPIIVSKLTQNAIQLKQMSGHQTFAIQPSRFQWDKFKDSLHFYVMLGVIPITAIVMYANIFIGPATLTETPADTRPNHWEYHRHPISRFLARYLYPSPQQEYEKMCHNLYEENEKALVRQLEIEVRAKMSERNDYKSYYYRPAMAKYHRVSKEAADYLKSIRGD